MVYESPGRTYALLALRRPKGAYFVKSLLLILLPAGAAVLLYAVKKCRLRHVLLSAAAGLLTLVGTDLVAGFLNISVPLNALSLSLAAVGGVPGVILYHVMTAVFR